MSENPHFSEDKFQAAVDEETARYGRRRYETPSEAPLDEAELGGQPGRTIPPSLPDGKSPEWYATAGRMLVDEAKARRIIRATREVNLKREEKGLPPIDIDPGKI